MGRVTGLARVYIADTPAEAWHIHNVLAQHGIQSRLMNEALFGATGEIPVLESLPEVWVKESEVMEAEAIIKAVRSEPVPNSSWLCHDCGEHIDSVFAICWKCGASLADAAE